mmetsp:Transcript_24637/g.51170  ORF Transcript_24637/g.51170 Transcript_24637/m.51170 type:complete len:260 (-) Transcript_24637:58-837(-)
MRRVKINTGTAGSTPVKSHSFVKTAAPATIPNASPGNSSASSGGKSVLRTAEEREATKRRRELWIQRIEEEDRRQASAAAFDSPPPSTGGGGGSRPKTSRGERNPDPEKFADYVIMSPTKDLAEKGEVMQFGAEKDNGDDDDLNFYPSSRSGGADRVTQMKSRGLDYDESFGDEASSGGDSEANLNDADDDDDDDDDLAYDNSYDDNIFTPSRDAGHDDAPSSDNQREWVEESLTSASAQLEKEYARQGRALIALALSL